MWTIPLPTTRYENHLREGQYDALTVESPGDLRRVCNDLRVPEVQCKYTLEHPDKVAAYIGVGQFVDIESDIYSYEDALTIAKAQGVDTADLEAAYSKYSENMTVVNMMNLRGLVSEYHPVPNEANTIWLGIASPYMGVDDLRWFLKQMGDFEEYVKLNQQLFDYIMVADVREYGLEYQVPVGFISGSEDWITPVKYSEDYYDAVSASMKDIALIDGCGHSPHYDSPEEFCDELKEMLEDFCIKRIVEIVN